MNRLFLATAVLVLGGAAAVAQQSSTQSPYQGQSNPPSDDAIVTDSEQLAKPPAGHPMAVQAPDATPAPVQTQAAQQPTSVDPNANYPAAGSNIGTDADTVAVAPPAYAPPLGPPTLVADPDGDIVHPRALRLGEIAEGTTIRVRLLDRLSTAQTERGEVFRSQVANDVLQSGQVLIAAGTEIDGSVVEVSSGHVAGTGSMRLRPETIILADGTRYRLFAQVTSTPGSHTHVAGEGVIKPNSRWKRNGIEYGGAVGAGVLAGGLMAGPMGALTGAAIGAGAVTAHLLINHPQATLEPGTTLMLELTGPLQMTAPNPSGN